MDESESVFYLLQQPLLILALAMAGGLYAFERWAHTHKRSLALRLGAPLGENVREVGVARPALGGEFTRDLDERGLRFVVLSPTEWVIYPTDDEHQFFGFYVLRSERTASVTRLLLKRFALFWPWAGVAALCAVALWIPTFGPAMKALVTIAVFGIGSVSVVRRLRAEHRRVGVYVDALVSAFARARR